MHPLRWQARMLRQQTGATLIGVSTTGYCVSFRVSNSYFKDKKTRQQF